MKNFSSRIAVITGGGTGMGRELARQLSAEGCHVAICDVSEESMAQTKAICERAAPRGTRITTTIADVSDEPQVIAFRDAVAREHRTDHIHLLFNNAGIGARAASSGMHATSGRRRSVCAGSASTTARARSCRC
jgi:NAD(P)-dependent dehydrogenase (short-subunit alcohol dehydrogenase family)